MEDLQSTTRGVATRRAKKKLSGTSIESGAWRAGHTQEFQKPMGPFGKPCNGGREGRRRSQASTRPLLGRGRLAERRHGAGSPIISSLERHGTSRTLHPSREDCL